jgi:alkylation response protein AidB-like acyl-CoA dehydrogenase
MNTFLSASQETLKEKYQAFAKSTIAPQSKALEEHKVSLKDFFKTIGQAGYCGITVPKEFSGQGGSLLDLVLFVESACAFEPGLGMTLACHTAAIELIKKYGTDTQKARFLPLLATGEIVATVAFAEENAGTDWQAVESTVIAESGKLVLNGKKVWTVNAEIAKLIVVLARSADKLSLLLVSLSPDAIAGGAVSFSPDKARLGLRSCFINDAEFQGLKMNEESIIATDSQAVAAANYVMDVAKAVLSASCIGLTQEAMQEAVEHARNRKQFGVNIGQFQGIQWKLADMSVELEGARLQTYRAAWAHDERPEDFRRFSAMAKLFASKVAKVHSGEAMQVLGTFGISADSNLERFYRDAKMTEICLGTSEAQKLVLVAELGI